jgi:hypothetical protein
MRQEDDHTELRKYQTYAKGRKVAAELDMRELAGVNERLKNLLDLNSRRLQRIEAQEKRALSCYRISLNQSAKKELKSLPDQIFLRSN